MLVTVVGSGKLATELLEHLELPEDMKLQAWSDLGPGADAAFVVHAGSGRELEPVIAYCECSGATLLELATGSVLENACPAFPVVLCPNTNILMLKFMSLLASSGPLLRGYHIRLEESHQHGKTSAPARRWHWPSPWACARKPSFPSAIRLGKWRCSASPTSISPATPCTASASATGCAHCRFPPRRPGHGRGDGGLLLGRMAGQGHPRCRHEEDDGRPAHGPVHPRQPAHAV
jgi:hypothetical protein